MSDNSLISGVQSEEEQQPLNYLSNNKNEQIKAYAQEKQNWGKNKAKYYKEDAQSVDSDAELEEEMEAKALQLKQAKKVQDIDLWDDQVDYEEHKPQNIAIKNLFNNNAIQCLSEEVGMEPHIIQNLDTKELNNLIFKGWPELKGILKEIDSVGKQIQKTKKLQKSAQSELNKYLNVRLQLFQSYLALLFFYLQLKAKTKLSQHHPIYQKINDIKQSIEDSENYEKFAQLLQMNVDEKNKKQKKQKIVIQQQPTEVQNEDTLTLKRKLKTLYNKQNKDDVNEKKISKIRKLLEDVDKKHQSDQKLQQESDESKVSIHSEDMIDALQDEQGQDEVYQENLNRIKDQKKQKRHEKKQEKLENFNKLNKLQKLKEVSEDDPRKITYVMLKNISLMRRRRGNRIKNSRVKHKLKYEKALYKLKSQNKYLKNPQSNYVGEGAIKSGIVKGVRLQ